MDTTDKRVFDISFLDSLHNYHRFWKLYDDGGKDFYNDSIYSGFISFLTYLPQALMRSHQDHFTASAVITSDFTDIILIHHKKLNLWLQPGGHADGEWPLYDVAEREAREETGLTHLTLMDFTRWRPWDSSIKKVMPPIFDIDIHTIHETLPTTHQNSTLATTHKHYDVRYLFITKSPNQIAMNFEESIDIACFSLDEAQKKTNEPSTQRLFTKLHALKKGLSIS